MTRQEEIKEGVEDIIFKSWEKPVKSADLSFDILSYLHSQGVVIKVKGELPKRIWYGDFGGESGEAGYTLGLRDMADYCKTEPLIEDNET